MNKGIAVRQTDRQDEGERKERRQGEGHRKGGFLYRGRVGVDGSKRGERLCWWRLCVWAHVCLSCTHVSGYAAHRKQTAANPFHTRKHNSTHKADSRHK